VALPVLLACDRAVLGLFWHATQLQVGSNLKLSSRSLCFCLWHDCLELFGGHPPHVACLSFRRVLELGTAPGLARLLEGGLRGGHVELGSVVLGLAPLALVLTVFTVLSKSVFSIAVGGPCFLTGVKFGRFVENVAHLATLGGGIVGHGDVLVE